MKNAARFVLALALLILPVAALAVPTPTPRPIDLGVVPFSVQTNSLQFRTPTTESEASFAQAASPAATTTTTVPASPPGTTVQSDTTVSVGSIASELYNAAAALFVTTLSGSLVALVINFLRGMNSNIAKMGADLVEKYKTQLQDVMNRGAIASAAVVKKNIDGTIPIDVKSRVVADAVKYAQTHAADLIKKLGGDPQSPQTVEVLTARAEIALADPAVPVTVAPETTAPPAQADTTTASPINQADLIAALKALQGQGGSVLAPGTV
jgi:hypothetical protein